MLGRAVRIPADLSIDPRGKQGAFGTIIGADGASDWIRVIFENGLTGDYQFNGLETLATHKALLYGLTIKNGTINRENFQIIQNVIALTFQGKQLQALKLAYSSPVTERFCIVRVDEYFEIRSDIKKYLDIPKKGMRRK